MKRQSAFTLIEILVALSIIAVALAAGLRTLNQSADHANLLKHRTLALWVAENRFAELRTMEVLPSQGSVEGEALQAGIAFVWRQTVTETPNPSFRKVDIRVVEKNDPDYELARLNSYVGVAAEKKGKTP
ncbi:MAG: type II secretion system minor pseudopilin GspI [Burkholderiales bacterium]|jgi:general secretion pathway protein I|nr:type II secretion system minor pseudopilin GspI [Burkholderiales bacterium]